MMPRSTGFSVAVVCGLAATAGAQNVPGNPSRPGMPVKTVEINVSDEVKARVEARWAEFGIPLGGRTVDAS